MQPQDKFSDEAVKLQEMIKLDGCIQMKHVSSLRIINGKVPVLELEHFHPTKVNESIQTFFSMMSDANV